MAHHLTEEFQSFRPPLPFLDSDLNMEFLTHLSEMIPSVPVTSFNFQNSFSGGPPDGLFSGSHVVPEFPGIFLSDSFPAVLQQNCDGFVSEDVLKVEMQEQRKRKAVEISGSRVCDVASVGESKKRHVNIYIKPYFHIFDSVARSEIINLTYLQSSGSAKRKKSVEKEDEKPREVVHVRARRGQATDSHSLAERVDKTTKNRL